ncbi:hypothetical protein PC113_g19987 [Phytophthora cactorum]|uniref:EF-hand domain-containing protein n=1 Tax=Phytophthora cactorum TaxID=29920 RepID=A0A8T0YEX4_9STRA|nr:hypothetical protein PC113_g19987 [Phytophthora cactorum]KAG2996515.1 hypothetical protein PC120_g21487 [Phytophthora cactorum]
MGSNGCCVRQQRTQGSISPESVPLSSALAFASRLTMLTSVFCVEHQLLRLHVLLGDDEAQLDGVYKSFQAVDPKGRGSLKNATELELVLREHLSPKNLKKIDTEALIARFSSAQNCFDYKAFCRALQQPPSFQAESSQSGRQSPTKRRSRSPTKLRIRMDKRLESQRLLMESVRQKLIRGVQGDDTDGFQGIQNILNRLDNAGAGYLDVKVFTKKFLQHLKVPLTRPEREFLLEQLRQSSEKGQDLIDYEQLGRVCNLNSDDSVSESDIEQEQPKVASPSKTSQLGAKFLAAEKQLQGFLRTPLASTSADTQDTPRCHVTGAEKFLELAEAIDQDNTGLLHEDEFSRTLSKCGVNIDPDLLNGMLSRFPRSSGKLISYAAFLQRFGHNPQYSRGRRELKQLVLLLLARLTVPAPEWIRFLHRRFEKCDRKLHGAIKSSIPTEVFMRAVQGRSVVLKLSTDEAAQVTSLFFRSSSSSSSSHLHYHEFLMFIDECHRTTRGKIPPAIDTKLVPATPKILSPTSPKRTKLSQPEAPTEPPLNTPEMSVGGYLMFHALPHERRNFENLMEMLQKFQNNVHDDHDSAIQRIANGIMMPLGKRLRVKVQFSIDE